MVFPRFLYCLFLAIDANFRLKRRMVSSEHADPSLINGGAYFVREEPFKTFLDEFDKKIEQKACSSVSSTTCTSTYLLVL
jgi:hypothetical protein